VQRGPVLRGEESDGWNMVDGNKIRLKKMQGTKEGEAFGQST